MKNSQSYLSKTQKIDAWFFRILQIPMLMACFTIIKIKSSKDIIQGISKLDYLYKVSRFQVLKNEDVTLEEFQQFKVRRLHCCTLCFRGPMRPRIDSHKPKVVSITKSLMDKILIE